MRDIKSKMGVAGRVGASGGRPTDAGREHPHGGAPTPAPSSPVEHVGRSRRVDDDDEERVRWAALCHYMIQPFFSNCMKAIWWC
jgi:hypothetical protein